MGVIKTWNTVYPVAIDDLVTNFPVLVDATDEVIASHSNELAKAVVALETEQQAIVTTVSGLGNIQALYNSVSQTTTLRSINFTGSGVSVSTAGNAITVTVNTSTTDRYSDTIIVGNAAAGDTTATCHYLETGTGAAIVSALTAAGALSPPGNVFIRRGTYTTTAQTTMISVPAGVHVSGAGVGATIITGRSTGDIGIFSVKAGASLSNLTVTAPTPSAGSTCPSYIVELLNNTTLKNVVINVASGSNSPVTFVTGYYAAGIPDGITIEDVRINITGSSIPAAYIDPIDIGDSSGATYTNPTKPVSIKNVVVDVSGANKDSVAAAMSLYSLGVSIDCCKAVGCSLMNFSPSGSLGTATVAGPTVKNCIADLTGRPAGTHYGVPFQPVCYNGTVIGTIFDGITVIGSASSAAGSRAVLFNAVPTSSTVTFKGNTLSNVSSYFSTAGAGGIDIEAQTGATVSNTKVSNCAVTGDSLISCAATGYVADTDILNNAGRNFTVSGTSANTTGLRLASPRFTGTITINEATTRTVGYYTVATTANLPNVSGSPTQTTALVAGDEAYVTGTAAKYVCTTATPGAAVWVPVATLAGQLGQTSNLPDVRGIRETAGPTLLTIGSIADGQTLIRSGTSVVGTTVTAAPAGTMVKPNLRLAGCSPTTAPTAVAYRDIAWSSSLNLFCAVGAAGTIVTSPDGITWTARTSGTAYDLLGVCWAAGLGLFVACGNDSGGFNAEVRTSPDGITWTQRYTAANPPALNGVATNAAGTTVIAFGTAGLILSSTNGTSWTSRTSQFSTTAILQAAWNGSLFVAVGGSGKISTSPDGITWTSRTSGTANGLIGVAANAATGRTVAIGATGTVITSTDGITWGTGNTLQNVGSGNLIQIGFGDGVFIVGPFSSGTACWVSPDGLNWSLRVCNTGANFGTAQPTRGAVFGNGRYVWPASSVFVSSDAIT